MKTAFHIKVLGRVQGVGFRYSAQKEAMRCHVTGWVRNEFDGSVEVLCEGSEENVRRYLQWLSQGPPGSSVVDLRKSRIPYKGTYRRFTIEF